MGSGTRAHPRDMTHCLRGPGLDLLYVAGEVLPGEEAPQVHVQLLPELQQVPVGVLQPGEGWHEAGARDGRTPRNVRR